MTGSITLAQITDTHLLTERAALLRGWDVWGGLQQVLARVSQQQPDGLLLTGDLADQGCPMAYGHLKDAIAALNLPVYWLPGNHDDLAVMQTVFHPSLMAATRSIDLGTWRLLLLNSVLPGARFGEGHLSWEELQWLETELTRHSQQPTAIALHHHPVPTGIDWLDQMQVQNAGAFLAMLGEFPQVRLVTFGHIHLELHYQHQHRQSAIAFYGCPATGPQVLPPNATPDQHLPGFRLLTLFPDGSHQTQVQRVPW
jgi:Icc protein